MRRKDSPELQGTDPESPVRAIRVKCCHMCGAACGKVMCDACGQEHLRILQAQLAQLRGQPFPRSTEEQREAELTKDLSPTQLPKEQVEQQKQIVMRMDGKPASEEPPY